MKKYLLFLSSIGLLVIFGLASFVKAVKSDVKTGKKVIQQVNPKSTSILNRQLLALEFERSLNPKVTEKPDRASKEEIMQNISELPLTFEKNMGQWQQEILYRAATPVAQVGFRKNGLTFCSSKELEDEHNEDDKEEEDDEEEIYETMVWNLNFKGMNLQTKIVAEGEVAGVTHYLLGNDSTKWVRNTPESRLIKYKEIYNNIDLHYYGLENHMLEYDYIVKPEGNIASIQMELDGAGGLKINDVGELVITTPWGKIAEAKPYSYQLINGIKKEIDIRYQILNDKIFGFKAYGSYDANYDLVIDPKKLVWTTFTKGTGDTYYVQDIAIDANKNSYITGWSTVGFPTTAGTGFKGSTEDAFVCKFNRMGTALVYATYLGGSAGSEERAFAIAVNGGGNAYVTGRTDAADFPTLNAFDATLGGTTDGFISKLNTLGTGFIYSTFVGGTSSDKGGKDLYVNSADELYATGMGKGTTFPTFGTVVRPAAMSNGSLDAFVLMLDPSGVRIFSTLLGGDADDEGNGIHVSASGEVYVTGQTKGGSFPMVNSLDASYGGGNNDAFVVKLSSNADAIIYSTYIGGSGNDIGYAIHSRNNEAYVTGITQGGIVTTTGAFRTAPIGGYDNFVIKLSVAGNTQVYSTYLGGTADENLPEDDAETGNDIVVNNNGEAYVSSISLSTDYPMFNGYFSSSRGNDDGVLTLLNSTGTNILCSTYIGGEANDYKKLAIALDLSSPLQDTVYVSITSHSNSPFDVSPASPGTFPVAQTQGTVYNSRHTVSTDGGDQSAVLKFVSCMVPLPVELISFKGSNKGDHNLLEWSTATEKNNDYFNVERSTNGINFLVIGAVDGAGNSNLVLNYSYSDPKEGEEIVYYRLKQTDFNGQISYSDVVAINAAQNNKALELTIISPVTDQLNYKVCCLHKGNAHVEVIDLSGRVVISATIHVNEGYNKLTLDSKTLAEGLYILKFTANNGTVKAKFVK